MLALLSASGAMLMGSANDLIIVFLGLEILSIALYVLTAFNHHMATSGEAALKYFILGGFSSAIFIYGIALTYGATGSTNLTQIADYLSKNVVLTNGLLLAGLALMLVGFAFKVAAVPFHMWTPDVYEGAPTPVTGFMAAVAKVGAFAALLRVLFSSLGVISADWRPIIYGLAVLSLFVGAVVALRQRDVKRMLAYSSINHAGFILLGVYAATPRGVSASLYYLMAYTFMTIGTFAIVTVLGPHRGRGSRPHPLPGPGATPAPVWPCRLAILLLAQAGVPFTTGLWAKLQVVLATVSAGAVPLAVIAMVTAAIAAFFYLRVAVLMYVSQPRPVSPATPSPILCRPRPASGAAALPSAGPDGMAATVTTLNTELLLADDAPASTGEETPTVIPIPALTSVAIGICAGLHRGLRHHARAAAGLRQPRHAPLLGPLARRVSSPCATSRSGSSRSPRSRATVITGLQRLASTRSPARAVQHPGRRVRATLGARPGVRRPTRSWSTTPWATFHYLTMYLMTEPLAETLDEFAEVRERVAKLGRFYEHRRARLSGAWVFLEAMAAPRSLVAPEVIPWRPNRGIYVVIDEPLDAVEALRRSRWGRPSTSTSACGTPSHFPQLLEVPGVAGLWSFATRRWGFARSEDPPPDPQAQDATRITVRLPRRGPARGGGGGGTAGRRHIGPAPPCAPGSPARCRPSPRGNGTGSSPEATRRGGPLGRYGMRAGACDSWKLTARSLAFTFSSLRVGVSGVSALRRHPTT